LIDHLSLGVTDLARSIAFYDAVLGALGYGRLWTSPAGAGYGVSGHDEPFAIRADTDAPIVSDARTHIAFVARARNAARGFYEAALAHGGRDAGGVGLHLEYGDGYFAAFVTDPDGHRLEAVLHELVH